VEIAAPGGVFEFPDRSGKNGPVLFPSGTVEFRALGSVGVILGIAAKIPDDFSQFFLDGAVDGLSGFLDTGFHRSRPSKDAKPSAISGDTEGKQGKPRSRAMRSCSNRILEDQRPPNVNNENVY